MTGKNT